MSQQSLETSLPRMGSYELNQINPLTDEEVAELQAQWAAEKDPSARQQITNMFLQYILKKRQQTDQQGEIV